MTNVDPVRRRTESNDPLRFAASAAIGSAFASGSSSTSSPFGDLAASSTPSSSSSAAVSATAQPIAPSTAATPLSTSSATPTAVSMSADEGSSASHASSSRLGTTSTVTQTSSSRHLYQPLSLADALIRANQDETRALDEVLAERNKLCLEATKLGSENVRIWNLVRRFKKENEELKAASRSASAASNSTPISAYPTTISPSPSDPGPEATNLASLNLGAPLSNNSHLQATPKASPLTSTTATAPHLLRQLKGSDPASLNGANLHPSSPLSTSVSAPPSAASFSTDSATHEPTPSTPVTFTNSFPPLSPPAAIATPSIAARDTPQSPQQTNIMLQRAAAQAQRMAVMTSARADGQNSGRNSMENHDFEAVDGSSMAGSDLEEGRSDQVAPTDGTKGVQSVVPSTSTSEKIVDKKQLRLSSTSNRRLTISADSLSPNSSSPFTPRLDATTLAYVNVTVVGTNFRSNERAKEDTSFFIAVDLKASPSIAKLNTTSWRVEKLYSAIVALDGRLKQKHSKSKSTVKGIASVQLPDRNLFKDHAPSKVDQRKVMLEAYLQNLLTIPMPDKDDLCTFFCTDAIPVKLRDPDAITKEGHLTKKGTNLGRWVTRLYSLSGSTLDYYENRGGPQLGSINIVGAQIGRQQKSDAADMDENSYRHAFLILETRPALSPGEQRQMVRHVLCAESDEERDDWVDVLVRAIAAVAAASSSNKDVNNGQSSPLQSVGASTIGVPTSPTSPTTRKVGRGDPSRNNESRLMPRKESVDDGFNVLQSRRQSAHHVRQGEMPKNSLLASPVPNSIAANAADATSSNALGMTRSRSDIGRYSLDDQYSNVSPATKFSPLHPALQQKSQAVNKSQQGRLKSNTLDNSGSLPKNILSPSNDTNYGALPANLPESSSVSSGLGTRDRSNSRPAISAPMNGTPIPSGYKFGGGGGGKDEANAGQDTKKRFWHRFGGAGGGGEKGGQPKKVFGVSLSESIAVSNVSEGLELPSVVYRCIEYLEKRNAAMEEGIYRLSGSSAVIKSLRERFNVQGDVNLLAPSEPFYDPHAIAGLLKQFLRELTDSVLTRELHFDFLRVNELSDRKERVNELGHLVSLLPLANYSLLRTLCNHLIKVIELSDVNKMTMRNVGIVFSPTLGIPGGVFALFMTEFDWVFFTDAQGEPAPKQIEEDILAPDNNELGIREHTPSPVTPTRELTPLVEGQDEYQVTEPLSPARAGRNGNRSSWISGNALHSGDGRVMMSLNKRDNRNSLSYNEAEADKLLGGPQSRYRLSSHHEDIEATLNNMLLTNSQFTDHGMNYADQDQSSDVSSKFSPNIPTVQLHGSPLGMSRNLPRQYILTPDPSYVSHSNSIPNTPNNAVNNPRLRSNSYDPRSAAVAHSNTSDDR